MLHEASSVTKAVQKAWENSGKPREFTINVLELGETNFFGFSTRPAIVSITFDPRHAAPQVNNNDRRDQSRNQRPQHQAGRDDAQRRDQRNNNTVRPDRNAASADQQRPARPARTEQPQRQQQEPRLRDPQREQKPREQRDQHVPREQQGVREGRELSGSMDSDDLTIWTPELTADLQADAAALVANAQIVVPYTIAVDKRNAVITFASAVLPESDFERQLFMSMSYLLIQFLKKKHKKKLRGFHVTVTSNRSQGAHQPPAAE
jgi:predicted RNA-binding protein Jag